MRPRRRATGGRLGRRLDEGEPGHARTLYSSFWRPGVPGPKPCRFHILDSRYGNLSCSSGAGRHRACEADGTVRRTAAGGAARLGLGAEPLAGAPLLETAGAGAPPRRPHGPATSPSGGGVSRPCRQVRVPRVQGRDYARYPDGLCRAAVGRPHRGWRRPAAGMAPPGGEGPRHHPRFRPQDRSHGR